MSILLAESTIPESFTLKNELRELSWSPTDTEDFYKVVFYSISHFLKTKKQKGHTIGFRIVDIDNGMFKLGAKVDYEEPTGDDPSGNWSYCFTFKEEDMKECELVYDLTDAGFQYMFMNDAIRQQRMTFGNFQQVQGPIVDSVDCIYEFLDQNAQENNAVELEVPGYFVAKVSVKDGIKSMSLTPSGEMKTLVKSDSDTQEQAA